MEEAADSAPGVLGEDEHALRVVPERVHRHREAALGPTAAPLRRDARNLAPEIGIDLLHTERPYGEPGFAQPGHGLAHLANRGSLERELGRTDNRLVAEVDGMEAETAIQRYELPAGPERGNAPARGVCDATELH